MALRKALGGRRGRQAWAARQVWAARSQCSFYQSHLRAGGLLAAAVPPRARRATRAWARQRATRGGHRLENYFWRQTQGLEVGEVAWPLRGRPGPAQERELQSWGEQLRFPRRPAALMRLHVCFCWCPLAAQPGWSRAVCLSLPCLRRAADGSTFPTALRCSPPKAQHPWGISEKLRQIIVSETSYPPPGPSENSQ